MSQWSSITMYAEMNRLNVTQSKFLWKRKELDFTYTHRQTKADLEVLF